jgi:hypothetical protein
MSSSENEGGTSRRSELKKLHFQKTQEMKKAKSKADKEAVEAKFRDLEASLLSISNPLAGSNVPSLEILPESLYRAQGEVSRAQKKRESKRAREDMKRADIVAAVGDGSAEAALALNEMSDIMSQVPEGFIVKDIPSDGDCMFASLTVQMEGLFCSRDVREMVADYLSANEEDFKFFIDEESSFEDYCAGIRSSSWGSELELEIVSRIFEKPILVYTPERVISIGENFTTKPLRVSFHRLQYSSPHYNAVVPG